MAAFKDGLDAAAVRSIAGAVASAWPPFDVDGFVTATAAGLAERELKQRVLWIAEQLRARLPEPYGAALEVLLATLGPPGAKAGDPPWAPEASDRITGFRAWPIAHFVGAWGLDHREASLDALEVITSRFSGEFAIRHFLLAEPAPTLARLHTWAQSDDQHLRRLASEGSRPRLPWGVRLGPFVADPSPLFGLLDRLKDDPEEYVRRSVANNLNDIAKDHPGAMLDVLERWQADDPAGARARLVAHACRTLIKQGEPRALRLLGFAVPPRIELVGFELDGSSLRLGEALHVTTELRSTGDGPQRLAIDYAMDLPGKGARRREKVFKGSVRTLEPGGSIVVRWKHALKAVSTRRYYDGPHGLQLIVNGERLLRREFELSGC